MFRKIDTSNGYVRLVFSSTRLWVKISLDEKGNLIGRAAPEKAWSQLNQQEQFLATMLPFIWVINSEGLLDQANYNSSIRFGHIFNTFFRSATKRGSPPQIALESTQ